MYQFLDTLIANISNVMYSYLLIIMLLAVGIYFTFRTKFVQLKLLGESIRVVTEKKEDGSVSSFQALMVSTASRVGTGNIVGVANAIAIGGYGAVFWMWVIAIVGGASAFIESTLAQIYKNAIKTSAATVVLLTTLKQRLKAVGLALCLQLLLLQHTQAASICFVPTTL